MGFVFYHRLLLEVDSISPVLKLLTRGFMSNHSVTVRPYDFGGWGESRAMHYCSCRPDWQIEGVTDLPDPKSDEMSTLFSFLTPLSMVTFIYQDASTDYNKDDTRPEGIGQGVISNWRFCYMAKTTAETIIRRDCLAAEIPGMMFFSEKTPWYAAKPEIIKTLTIRDSSSNEN